MDDTNVLGVCFKSLNVVISANKFYFRYSLGLGTWILPLWKQDRISQGIASLNSIDLI